MNDTDNNATRPPSLALTRMESGQMEIGQHQALDAAGRKAAIDELMNKILLVQEVMKRAMQEGEHFGTIPGCGPKPALLKAGAEKLGMTFRLKPEFRISERDLGRGHVQYSVTCVLSDGTQGVGSCSTMESKYRFRGGERKCPECGKATIIKGKREYGGGWICFEKKGGCKAKFADDDPAIVDQNVERTEHDNPADFYNTCLKMGKKRAHVDAIITATACSDIFTQDIDEGQVDRDSGNTNKTAPSSPAPEKQYVPAPNAGASPPPQQNAASETIVGYGAIRSVTQETITSRSTGKTYKPWRVVIQSGEEEIKPACWSKSLADVAQKLADDGGEVEFVIEKKDGKLSLVELKRREPELPMNDATGASMSAAEDDVPF